MSPRAYPKYRSSGIKWVGSVPAHWEIKRLKNVFRLINGGTPPSAEDDYWDGNIVWFTPDDLGHCDSKRVFESRRMITKAGLDNSGASLAPPGSVVLSTRAPIGHIAISGVECSCNQGCRILDRRTDIGNDYYYYLLIAAKPMLQASGKGTTFLELSGDALASQCIVDPPISEQAAIAGFLDSETEKIDTLIAKKRELIDKLKEKRSALISQTVTKGLPPDEAAKRGLPVNPPTKPSSADWLGDVPVHWTFPPLYCRYKVELGKMLDEKRISGESLVPYLRNVDVQWDRINLEDLPEMDIFPLEAERYTVREGDLLVCEGGEVGRCAIVPQVDRSVGYQKALHRLRSQVREECPRYMFYVLTWAVADGVFTAEGNSSTIEHLTGEKLRRYRFPAPPADEQRAIATFLDREAGKIDSLTTKIEEAIERLQEYRSALIVAAVTGKIDVRHSVAKAGN